MNVLDRPNNTKTNCYITCGGVWSEEFPFSVIVLWLKYFIFYYSSCCEPLTFSLCVWEGEKDRARENESHWLQMDWKVLWPSDKSELSQKKKRRHHCSLAVTTVIHCSFYFPGVSFLFLSPGGIRDDRADVSHPGPFPPFGPATSKSLRSSKRETEGIISERALKSVWSWTEWFIQKKKKLACLAVEPHKHTRTRAQSLWPDSHSNPRVELSLGFCCAVIG